MFGRAIAFNRFWRNTSKLSCRSCADRWPLSLDFSSKRVRAPASFFGCDLLISIAPQSPGRIDPPQHKTEHYGHTRAIFFGPKAQEILAPFLRRMPLASCFSPREAVQERRDALTALRKTPLSCGNVRGSNVKRTPTRSPGDHYSVTSYGQAITRACKRANVPHWSPNQLRHTAATRFRREHGLEAAQILLGHARADVTQIYAERDFARAAQIAQEIG